jgi:hypothetical protein
VTAYRGGLLYDDMTMDGFFLGLAGRSACAEALAGTPVILGSIEDGSPVTMLGRVASAEFDAGSGAVLVSVDLPLVELRSSEPSYLSANLQAHEIKIRKSGFKEIVRFGVLSVSLVPWRPFPASEPLTPLGKGEG